MNNIRMNPAHAIGRDVDTGLSRAFQAGKRSRRSAIKCDLPSYRFGIAHATMIPVQDLPSTAAVAAARVAAGRNSEQDASAELLRRVNTAMGYDAMPLTERVQRAAQEAFAAMTPAWIDAMRSVPPWRKLETANSMFLAARDALFQQGVRAGLSPEQAHREAARRLLTGNTW